MKLPTRTITKPITLELTGEEEWLESLYSQFGCPKGQTKPILTGVVQVSLRGDDQFQVALDLTYTPFVPCSRCSELIPWGIRVEETFKVKETPESFHEGGGHVLQSDELDEYFLAEGAIDLGQMILDAVHTAIPQQTVPLRDESDHCRVCLEPAAPFEISLSDLSENPFKVLEGLKDKK